MDCGYVVEMVETNGSIEVLGGMIIISKEDEITRLGLP